MKRLINYIKEGKGRGLRAMLIFSAVMALLLWGAYYSVLSRLPITNPGLKISSTSTLHFGFICSTFVFTWIFYFMAVGLSALLCKVFKLKLNKGAVWRATAFAIIAFASIMASTSIIGTLLLKILAAILPTTQVTMLLLSVLSSVISLTVFFVILVMLIVFGIREPKETKKKK